MKGIGQMSQKTSNISTRKSSTNNGWDLQIPLISVIVCFLLYLTNFKLPCGEKKKAIFGFWE